MPSRHMFGRAQSFWTDSQQRASPTADVATVSSTLVLMARRRVSSWASALGMSRSSIWTTSSLASSRWATDFGLLARCLALPSLSLSSCSGPATKASTSWARRHCFCSRKYWKVPSQSRHDRLSPPQTSHSSTTLQLSWAGSQAESLEQSQTTSSMATQVPWAQMASPELHGKYSLDLATPKFGKHSSPIGTKRTQRPCFMKWFSGQSQSKIWSPSTASWVSASRDTPKAAGSPISERSGVQLWHSPEIWLKEMSRNACHCSSDGLLYEPSPFSQL